MRSAVLIGPVLVVSMLGACLGPIFGICSDEERAAFNEIAHFARPLTPQEHGLGGCTATFTTDADPGAVVDHYAAELQVEGWELLPPRPAPPDGPPPGEQGVPVDEGATPIHAVDARRGTMGFSAEVFEAGAGEIRVLVVLADAGG